MGYIIPQCAASICNGRLPPSYAICLGGVQGKNTPETTPGGMKWHLQIILIHRKNLNQK